MARSLMVACCLLAFAACGEKQDPVQEQPLDTLAGLDTVGVDTVPGVDTVDTKVRYADLKPLMDNKCAICHSTTLSGSARKGAPSGYNYNTYATCKAGADKGLETVLDNSMPLFPATKVTAAEKQLYQDWVAEGMLQ